MTIPIEQQLRDYFDVVDRAQTSTTDLNIPLEHGPPRLRLVDDEERLEMEDTMRAPRNENRPRRHRSAMLAVASVAAVAGLIAGFVIIRDRNDSGPAPAAEPTEEAQDLGFPDTTVEPGRYSTFLLGVNVTLTLEDDYAITEGRASAVALLSPPMDSLDVETARWIMMARIGGWNTGAEAVDPSFRGTGSIAPDDVDAWIDDNDLIVSERREVQVDGRDATVLDVVVDPAATGAPLDFPRDARTLYADGCGPDTAPCMWYRSISPESERSGGARPDPVMHAGQTRRMWLIPIGGSDPLLIEAIVPDDDAPWLDQFEASTIATLELGDDAPPAGV